MCDKEAYVYHRDCENQFSTIFPFWPDLSSQDKQLLCQNTSLQTYPQGNLIHNGNHCTGAIVVISGCLRVYLQPEQGREITLYRLFPGDICMLSASCVLEAITFDVTIDAEEDSTCYLIAGGTFADLAERNLTMKNFALEKAVSRFSDVMWVMQQILFMSFDKRLAIFLWDEITKTGQDSIKMTHEQIARYMGSAREVVSRMVKYFVAEGIVETSRGGLKILDRDKLKKLAL